MSTMNRIVNSGNMYQGSYKRVLCVCSAGLLRSPTTAVVLCQEPYNYNTRAAGIDEDFALIPVDSVLLAWAEEIICMTEEQRVRLEQMVKGKKPVICLKIPDNFEYRNDELMKMIRERYDASLARQDELKKPV